MRARKSPKSTYSKTHSYMPYMNKTKSKKPKAKAGVVSDVLDTVKKVGDAILSAPSNYIDAVGRANRRQKEALDNKEIADIERAFGSVDNYKKLDPLFRTRKERNSI